MKKSFHSFFRCPHVFRTSGIHCYKSFPGPVMKKLLYGCFILLLFILILLFPKIAIAGASRGLLLWFQVLIPTLFPFMLLCRLLLKTRLLAVIARILYPVLGKLFGTTPEGAYCVLTGFLCGYPVGAKLAADMYKSGYISRKEGCYLLSFCNNTSPSFIINYLVLRTLGDKKLLLPSIVILTAAPLIVSFFTRRFYRSEPLENIRHSPQPSSDRDTWTFREIDACIMDSFETLIKVGGYIILFSVILSLLQSIDTPAWFACLLSFLEITNGLEILKSLHLTKAICYPLMLGLTAFGGLCAIAQTQCMVQKAGFGILPYITQKLAAALTASLLGVLYLNIC